MGNETLILLWVKSSKCIMPTHKSGAMKGQRATAGLEQYFVLVGWFVGFFGCGYGVVGFFCVFLGWGGEFVGLFFFKKEKRQKEVKKAA